MPKWSSTAIGLSAVPLPLECVEPGCPRRSADPPLPEAGARLDPALKPSSCTESLESSAVELVLSFAVVCFLLLDSAVVAGEGRVAFEAGGGGGGSGAVGGAGRSLASFVVADAAGGVSGSTICETCVLEVGALSSGPTGSVVK